mgnify:CR=1 FL=1
MRASGKKENVTWMLDDMLGLDWIDKEEYKILETKWNASLSVPRSTNLETFK